MCSGNALMVVFVQGDGERVQHDDEAGVHHRIPRAVLFNPRGEV